MTHTDLGPRVYERGLVLDGRDFAQLAPLAQARNTVRQELGALSTRDAWLSWCGCAWGMS